MTEQLCDHVSSFPSLPGDLYSNSHQSSYQLTSPTRKHTRSTMYSSSALADCKLLDPHSQPRVQPCAAIAAFRPEEFTSISSQQAQWDPRRPHPAPAVLKPFLPDADGACFAAALSACAESLKSQQQAHGVVELPFPGMHTLDLAFPLAQPALMEAGQQLLERPREFQAALTQCPLSQVNLRHCQHLKVLFASWTYVDMICFSRAVAAAIICVLPVPPLPNQPQKLICTNALLHASSAVLIPGQY